MPGENSEGVPDAALQRFGALGKQLQKIAKLIA
jgi:hypothetical protein